MWRFPHRGQEGPLGLSVGGHLDGGRGPDFTQFVRTADYAEVNRRTRTVLLGNGNNHRDDDHKIKFNADLKYAREYRFETVPVKTTLFYYHILENTWVRFQNRADLGNNPPLLTVFNIEDSKPDVANLQIDYSPSIIDNYFLAGVESMIRYQVGPLAGDLWHSYEYSIDDQPIIASSENKLGFGGHYRYGEHLSLGLRAKYASEAEGQALDAQGNPLVITVPST